MSITQLNIFEYQFICHANDELYYNQNGNPLIVSLMAIYSKVIIANLKVSQFNRLLLRAVNIINNV